MFVKFKALAAVDDICFADPKSSVIDIVQAVGRALRQSYRQGKVPLVIIPVYLPSPEVGDDTGPLGALPRRPSEMSPVSRLSPSQNPGHRRETPSPALWARVRHHQLIIVWVHFCGEPGSLSVARGPSGHERCFRSKLMA
ncbi:hypothetical protein AB0A71_31795 [Kitasatospora aureofaciens]|uniref:hypothetical protein n=1 Tax=Kitasatospora aureofaciens TaxID=1894 RepID=UPI0033E4CA7B